MHSAPDGGTSWERKEVEGEQETQLVEYDNVPTQANLDQHVNMWGRLLLSDASAIVMLVHIAPPNCLTCPTNIATAEHNIVRLMTPAVYAELPRARQGVLKTNAPSTCAMQLPYPFRNCKKVKCIGSVRPAPDANRNSSPPIAIPKRTHDPHV